jgi:hypothetical protein
MHSRTCLLVSFIALLLAAPARADRRPVSLTIAKTTLIGGSLDEATTTGTVTIAEPAPPNDDWPVSLNASSSSIAITSGENNNWPNVCYVPAGSLSCTFNVRAFQVNQPVEVTITATSVNVSITTSVNVLPNSVTSLTLSPGELWAKSGQKATGTITIAHP